MSPALPTPNDPDAFTEAMTRAMQKAVRNALREHALLGRSVVTWRDGKSVWVPPEEVLDWLQATEELAAFGVAPPLGSFSRSSGHSSQV